METLCHQQRIGTSGFHAFSLARDSDLAFPPPLSTDAATTNPAATHSTRIRIPSPTSDTANAQVIPPIAPPANAPTKKRINNRPGTPTKPKTPTANNPLRRISAPTSSISRIGIEPGSHDKILFGRRGLF